jgi:hypothetical protein
MVSGVDATASWQRIGAADQDRIKIGRIGLDIL